MNPAPSVVKRYLVAKRRGVKWLNKEKVRGEDKIAL